MLVCHFAPVPLVLVSALNFRKHGNLILAKERASVYLAPRTTKHMITQEGACEQQSDISVGLDTVMIESHVSSTSLVAAMAF
jgi:hypothetical protein